jgi:methyl-accepting chemotaxis protein
MLRQGVMARFAHLVWVAGAAAAAAGMAHFGPTLPGLAVAFPAIVLPLGFGLVAARRDQKVAERRLALLGQAVGLKPGDDPTSIEAIARCIHGRLERAHLVRQGFAALEHPAAILDADGTVLTETAGFTPAHGELLAAAPGEHLIAGIPTRIDRVPLNGDRHLVLFSALGDRVAPDLLASLRAARQGGRLAAAPDTPTAQLLVDLVAAELASARAIDALLAGRPVAATDLAHPSPLAERLAQLQDLQGLLYEDRDDLAAQVERLDLKLAAILEAIDRYRASVATFAELADRGREGLAVASEALLTGTERAHAVKSLEAEARRLAGAAALGAEETRSAASGASATTAEIDRLVATVEDVSFRTNLLALNAAVEAARAGDKGAGFAVVASEVRTLAQATQKATREIRELVGRSREQAGVSAQFALKLKNILGELGGNLENLSNEADMMTSALQSGSGAIAKVGGSVSALGSEARKALQLPARRRSD